MNKVAIITRTRNRSCLLKRAIESVLQQSMPDWHHYIVNDGGDPVEAEKVCAGYQDAYNGRLTVMNLKHCGMQVASNAAVKDSKSEFIAIHDDDDSWHADFLKETTAFLDEKGPESIYQGVISRTERILEKLLPDGSISEIERAPYVPLNNISISRLGYENPFPPIALLYRRSVHDELGLFNPDWDLVADLDFNFRFLQKFEIGVIDEVLAFYHWRQDVENHDLSNTVTVQQKRHATLLNELKNHYLRSSDNTYDSTMAIAFLLSSFAVENQWMTSEIRQRTISCQEQLASLLKGLLAIDEFNQQAIKPEVEKLGEALRLLQDTGAQLQALRKFGDDNLSTKLDSLQGLVASILESTDSLADSNESLAKEKSVDEVLKRLKTTEKLLAEAVTDKEMLNALNNRFEVIDNQLKDLSNQLKGLTWEQDKQKSAIGAVEKELALIREENQRQWKLGPFKLLRIAKKEIGKSGDSVE